MLENFVYHLFPYYVDEDFDGVYHELRFFFNECVIAKKRRAQLVHMNLAQADNFFLSFRLSPF